VGVLPVYADGRVLMCKRSIAPRSGYWTLPAGFLENGETMLAGGLREMEEEACAHAKEGTLYRIYDLPYINQVYVFFLSRLNNEKYAAGSESEEVRLFAEVDIPWKEIAFPVVSEALRDYYRERKESTDNGADRNAKDAHIARYSVLDNPFDRKRAP
jgi:ADP-ribose pyrophosphatase YjhB (NUDIX family)